jgi:hypothetical protein
LYVPAVIPEKVTLAPEPAMAPGLIVHAPAGNPFSITLPVETEQFVCVMVPMVGAVEVTGCAFIITLAEAADIHPAELVTVKL